MCNGHMDCIEVLLEYSVDVDQQDMNTGCTPLHVASQWGYTDITKLLIGSLLTSPDLKCPLVLRGFPNIVSCLIRTQSVHRSGAMGYRRDASICGCSRGQCGMLSGTSCVVSSVTSGIASAVFILMFCDDCRP